MPNNSTLTLRLPLLCSMRAIDDHQASHAAAIKENPDNSPFARSDESASPCEHAGNARLLVAFSKYWARGRTLRIEFLRNPPDVITQPIMDAANKWLPHVNLKFKMVTDGPSDIRIGLNEHLNWSEQGTDALLIPQGMPTMEFNAQDLFGPGIKPLPELERIVLHEFGHMLGAVHEHQHPEANIPWNEPVLTALLKQVGYSDELIRKNFLDRYEGADFNHSPYDRDSIMHFDVPNLLTLGDFEVINTGKGLSPRDIQVMAAVYPDRSNSKFEQP